MIFLPVARTSWCESMILAEKKSGYLPVTRIGSIQWQLIPLVVDWPREHSTARFVCGTSSRAIWYALFMLRQACKRHIPERASG